MAPRIAAAPLSRVRLSLGSALKGLGLDRPHCRVLLAASGGPDSAALLAAFASLPEGRRPQAVAAHVDHGLHPAAAAAAIAVQRQAERFGLRLRLAALSRGSAPGLRFGSEAWARAGRYASLVDLAGQEGAQAILTAHHRDDQIETLVLRLLRKAGTRGLGGMPAVRWLAGGLLLVRPLLDQPRALLAQVVCAEGLGPLVVEDPTNRDERSLRNRVRHRLLPQLRNALHPGADALLAEVASVLRRAADLQAASVERLDRLLVADLPDGGCVIEARGLAALPPALQASLLLDRLHRLERRCEPRRVHVEALLVLAGRAAGRPGAARLRWCLPGGCWAEADRDRLCLHPAGWPGVKRGAPPLASTGSSTSTSTIGVGLHPLPELGTELGLDLVAPPPAALPWPLPAREAWFDAAAAPLPWSLRSVRPGERMVAFGDGRPRSLDGLLRQAGVPAELRRGWPLLLCGDQPLWLVGVRRASGAPVSAGCTAIVRARLVLQEGRGPLSLAGRYLNSPGRKTEPPRRQESKKKR